MTDRTLTLDEARAKSEKAARAYEAAQAEAARLADEDNARRYADLAKWAERVIASYDADRAAALKASGAATDAMRDAVRTGDLAAVLAAYRERARAQQTIAALFRRQEGACYALPAGHARKNKPLRTGDDADAYHHEAFTDVLDAMVRDIRAELDAEVRAALSADRPPSPAEGYEPPTPPVMPFGYDRYGTMYNKPISLMTDAERAAFERWRSAPPQDAPPLTPVLTTTLTAAELEADARRARALKALEAGGPPS